jgi:hypothetical protein
MRLLMLSYGFFLNCSFLYSQNVTPDFIHAAIVNSREKLVSGEFFISGARTSPGSKADVKIQIYSAFDHSSNQLRFDQQEGATLLPLAELDVRNSKQDGGKCVIQPDRTLVWVNGSPAVVIHPGGHKITPQIKPFDVRNVGLLTNHGYSQWCSHTDLLKYIKQLWLTNNCKVSMLSRGVYQATDVHEGTTSKLVVTEEHGYLPVSFELSYGKVTDTSTVIWKKISDIWVPSKVISTIKFNDTRYGIEYDFNWLKVNESINSQLFMTRGMELPYGSGIISSNGKKSVQLGKIGDMTPSPKLAVLEPLPSPWWRSKTMITVVAAIAVITLIFAYWRFRLRRAAT